MNRHLNVYEMLGKVEENQIRVIVKEPLKPAEIRVIDKGLHSMQEVVGGLIEVIRYKEAIDIYLNEEGKLEGLKPNLKLVHEGHVYDVVVGTVFFAKIDEEGNTVSLGLDECYQVLFEIDQTAITTEAEQQFYEKALAQMF